MTKVINGTRPGRVVKALNAEQVAEVKALVRRLQELGVLQDFPDSYRIARSWIEEKLPSKYFLA